MRRMHRIVLLAVLAALAPVLVGCESFDMDKFDIFGLSQKAKLPGDRKALFPEGVPGVSQGIPPEYIKGNQPPPETALAPPVEQDNKATVAAPAKKSTAAEPAKKTAAVAPVDEPKPKLKPKPKRKPKPQTASQPPAQAGAQAAQPAWPAPDQQQTPQQAQSPGQGQSTAPWPSAPAPGTFSR